MNKLFAEILPFLFALQIIAYLLWAFDVFSGKISYPLGDISSIDSIFSIDEFSILLGVGGGILIGVVSFLFKPGVYAIYALLIWVFGVTFRAVQTFLLVLPNTLGALIPNVACVTIGGELVNPIAISVTVIVGWALFWWCSSLIFQRDV